MKNVSIKLKVLGPIVLLAVMMVGTILLGITNLHSVMRASTEISGNYAQGIKQLGDISADFQSLNRVMFAHITARDMASKRNLESESQEIKADIDAICADYAKGLESGSESEAYQSFTGLYAEYVSIFDTAIGYSGGGESQRAATVANTELTEKSKQITENIDNMISINQQKMNDAISSQNMTYNGVLVTDFIILAVAVIVSVFAFLICFAGIIRPMSSVNRKLNKIIKNIQNGEGDLTQRVPADRKDEIGQLAGGINTFLETLQGIMGKIITNSNRLEKIVNAVQNNVSTANDSSCDISSVMEQLSASMEEMSSTVTTVNESTIDVDSNVGELADASKGLLSYANEMQKRASTLENTAIENKQSTSTVISEIIEKLRLAIEDSRSVSRVNDLTDEILNISSQTNLLALNASIEAARAGDAGKGFAVVADEIRQLADSSREAANNIQTINNMVVTAVNQLIANSDAIVKYIHDNIMPDYDAFVASGRQYNQDAVHVNDIVEQFTNMSGELKHLIRNITDAMNGISESVSESANGITTAASNTNNLVKGISKISSEMENNSLIAGELKKEADRFVQI